jgi:hypothetical protein
MKKLMLVAVLILASGVVWAAEDKLTGDLNLIWASKTMFRGMDVGDNKAAFMPTATFDLWGTGFSSEIMGWWNGGPTNGAEAPLPTEKYEYRLAYSNSFNKGDTAQVDYNLKWTYADYYAHNDSYNDYQDLALTLSLPKVWDCVVPHYTFAYTWSGWPGDSGGLLGTKLSGGAGFYHIVGVDYNFKVADQPLTFSAEATYNDGVFAYYGKTSDHDWSHVTWGLRTAFKLGCGTFVPGIYYQTSLDDSVNKNDEFYTVMAYKIGF